MSITTGLLRNARRTPPTNIDVPLGRRHLRGRAQKAVTPQSAVEANLAFLAGA